jgi:hypothetical protein
VATLLSLFHHLRYRSMSISRWLRFFMPMALGVLSLVPMAKAEIVLVADRLSNSVYSYSDAGGYRNVVVNDPVNLIQPSGLIMSPDRSKLYVADLAGSVIRYDYNTATGTASNPFVFGDSTEGLAFPNGLIFSPDGSRLLVSNLGGTGIAQFDLNGDLAGPPINGLVGFGAFFQFAGMAYAPTGELLVAAFQDFPTGTTGAVAKSNPSISSLTDFIPANPTINGASSLLVNGGDLYVSGLAPFLPTGNIARFDVNSGAVDAGFLISGVESPQTLMADPNGVGFLAGILGATNGTGKIAHYDFNGNLVGDGVFAYNANISGVGFIEPTAFITVVPEPTTFGLAGLALVGLITRRRIDG